MEEKQQKPKFKFSYIIILALLVLMAVLIFTNNGYKGQYLSGGDAAIEQLIDGKYYNEEKKENEQMIAYYTKKNILVEVDGTQDIEDVFAAIVKVLGE